jgi:hypothetical protein
MSNLFDTNQVRDDAAYWDALAERVAGNATRESKGSGFEWLAHSRSSWVVASLLLAGALAVMTLPAASPRTSSFSAEWNQALAPSDDVARAILLDDEPPAIGALIVVRKAKGGR